MSLLPVHKKTLCYGSNDGGVTVHTTNDRMNTLMQSVCSSCNDNIKVLGRGEVESEVS